MHREPVAHEILSVRPKCLFSQRLVEAEHVDSASNFIDTPPLTSTPPVTNSLALPFPLSDAVQRRLIDGFDKSTVEQLTVEQDRIH